MSSLASSLLLVACVQSRARDTEVRLERLRLLVAGPHVERQSDGSLHWTGAEGSPGRARRVATRLVDDRLFRGSTAPIVAVQSSAESLSREELVAALSTGLAAEEATVRAFDRSLAIELSDVELAGSATTVASLRYVFDFRDCPPSVVAATTTNLPVIGGYAVRISGSE